MDDKLKDGSVAKNFVLRMYTHGLTTRDIQSQLQERYGVEVSPTLIFNVTDAVSEEVRHWQSRPLEAVYPIVYVDGLVINKALHLVLGGEPARAQGAAGDVDCPE